MAIASNFPSIKPSLLLDFANVGRLDPRITFSRASTATYFNSLGVLTTANNNVARFDYDPSTLAAQGLLIEEQRTNLCLQSEDFATTWVATRASVTTNTIVAPNGALTGDKLVEDATVSSTHEINQTGITVVSGTTYATSIYIKAAERTQARVVYLASGSGVYADFNLSAGTVGAATAFNTATAVSSSIQSVGNGWYRCVVVGSQAAGTSGAVRVELLDASGNRTYTGDGTSGIFIWGAQLEAGAFATSYIPTTTTALTRNADVASMTGTNFSSWYNAAQGTVVFAATRSSSGQPYLWMFSNGATATERYYLRYVSSQYQFIPRAAGVDGAGAFVAAAGSLVTASHATAYVSNQNRISSNGGQDGNSTQTVTSQPTSLDTLYLGSFTGTAAFLNGTIQRLAFYPISLSNSTLQALTA